VAPLRLRIARLTRYGLAVLVGFGASASVVASTCCWLDVASAWAEPPKAGYPPDPPGVPTTQHWLFDVKVDKGVVSLDRVRPVTLKHAEPTPRVMGRYAIELWIGSELLDRLRFNVPLGGNLPREDDGRPFKRPSFDKVTARFSVRMADQPRATYLKLVDRATGEEQRFLWPPTGETLAPYHRGDAGTASDGGAKDGGAPRPPSGSARPDAGPAPDAGGSPDGGAPDAGKPDDAPLVPRRPQPAPAPPPPPPPRPTAPPKK
jgi:hypothetical protein